MSNNFPADQQMPSSPVSSYHSNKGWASPPLSPVSVDSSQFSYSDAPVSPTSQDPAQIKALELLGATAGMTPREAATEHYERLKMEKIKRKMAKIENKVERQAEKRSPLLKVAVTRKAETSRKVKVMSAEGEEGIETVHEMKCQLELDREEEAKKKALKLLDLGYM